MSRKMSKSLYMCTVLIISSASIVIGLTLEELKLNMQQQKEELGLQIRRLQKNEVSMKKTMTEIVSQLRKFDLIVQHLEAKLMEQQKECQMLRNTVKENVHLDIKHVIREKMFYRTCSELYRVDSSLTSGMYWIDPDGYGLEDPIHVHCDKETGRTSVPHDSENPTYVNDCAASECYSKLIKYSSSMRQMEALAELSGECHQYIRYDYLWLPVKSNGVGDQSWWDDISENKRFYWSHNYNSIEACECNTDSNSASPHNSCNCYSYFPKLLNDKGVITDKKHLPITRLGFPQPDVWFGFYTLGRFECSGQLSVSGVPRSCSDLWQIGHTLSGIYSVMGADQVETSVYCDFTKLPHEQDFQK